MTDEHVEPLTLSEVIAFLRSVIASGERLTERDNTDINRALDAARDAARQPAERYYNEAEANAVLHAARQPVECPHHGRDCGALRIAAGIDIDAARQPAEPLDVERLARALWGIDFERPEVFWLARNIARRYLAEGPTDAAKHIAREYGADTE